MQWIALLLVGLSALLAAPDSRADTSGHAVLVSLDGAISPATAAYFESSLDAAIADGARLLILELDTPGGLDSAMRDIIKRILGSPIPVVTYVSPSGSRAASAGTYILYASHIAAMAPATNLGAATPIPVGGSPGGSPEPKSSPDDHARGHAVADDPGAVPPAYALAHSRPMATTAPTAYTRRLDERRRRNAA